MEAVDRLNYTPNFGARAIAANRTGIFGVIIPTMENAIFARGIEAFQKVLLEKNVTMLVASSNYDPEQEARQIKTLVARGADGLVLIGFRRDTSVYSFLEERGIPVVTAWAITPDPAHSFVGFDNRKAAEEIVSKAISLGHKSIAYVSAPNETNDRASERVAGARDAIQKAGLDPKAMQLIETEYAVSNGAAAFHQLLANGGGELPSLVVCGNDVLAVGVIKAALAEGYDVPTDLSVTGFDNIEISEVVSPALTTVHVPHEMMGRIAAETLYTLVHDTITPVQVTLDTRIVERESLGPGPQE